MKTKKKADKIYEGMDIVNKNGNLFKKKNHTRLPG